MQSFIQKSLLTVLLCSPLWTLGTREIPQESLTEEKVTATLRAILYRWQGQEHRIKQLMYESTLSEKPLVYYNGNDHVATFNNKEQIVRTYLDHEGKIAASLTYEQMLVVAKYAKQESIVSDPDLTVNVEL